MSITPRRRRSDASNLPEAGQGLLHVDDEKVGRLEEEVAQMERQIAAFKQTGQARVLALQKQALDKYLGSLGHDTSLGREASAKDQDMLKAGLHDHDDSEEISQFRSLFERRKVARTQMAQIVDRTMELSQILQNKLVGS